MKAALKRLSILARVRANRIADRVSDDRFADQVDRQSQALSIVAIILALFAIIIPALITLYERGLLWNR